MKTIKELEVKARELEEIMYNDVMTDIACEEAQMIYDYTHIIDNKMKTIKIKIEQGEHKLEAQLDPFATIEEVKNIIMSMILNLRDKT